MNTTRRRALLLVALSVWALSPAPARAISGSASFAYPSPALLTVYFPQQWSTIGTWSNWGSIPAGSRVTNVMVLWNNVSNGGAGVHVYLYNQSGAHAFVGNGQWSNAFAGQDPRQNWYVKFYVDQVAFPGQPYNVGVSNLVLSYN